MTIWSIIVAILVSWGGQPFAGLTTDGITMHRDCVEYHVIVCSDGFTI